jgi:hypothetical protein
MLMTTTTMTTTTAAAPITTTTNHLKKGVQPTANSWRNTFHNQHVKGKRIKEGMDRKE